jgi:hypothetical protein
MGANIDAVETAARFGIGRGRAFDYVPDSKGTEINFAAMSKAVMSFREGGEVDEASFAEVRSDYKKRGGRK